MAQTPHNTNPFPFLPFNLSTASCLKIYTEVSADAVRENISIKEAGTEHSGNRDSVSDSCCTSTDMPPADLSCETEEA